MSTANYRYYNSKNGVGITKIDKEECGYAFIEGRTKAPRPEPWVAVKHLYLKAEDAVGKPHAVFHAKKPEERHTLDIEP